MSLRSDKLNENTVDHNEIDDALNQLEKSMMESKRKELEEKNKGRIFFGDVTERIGVRMSAEKTRFGETSVTTKANDKPIHQLYRPAVSNEGDDANAKKSLDESSRQHHLDSAQGREKAVNALKNGATSASSSSSYTGMIFSGNPDDVLAFLDKMNKTSAKPEVNKPEPQPQMQTQPKKR